MNDSSMTGAVEVIVTPEKANINAVVPLEFIDVNHISEQILISKKRNSWS